ncbi:Cytochrome P450 [Vigna unguiculata]|uniref:Cytochrome P450 n=1 Tax=Vigna unguiculata TaxID=3917 RepID=A0A4D6MSM2_VIGUN|nr:Cytochrome P450 [Vigna unguiculata]
MVAINTTKGVYEFVQARRLWYGNCFKTKLFQKMHAFISGTESAKVILNNEEKFSKKYMKSIVELVGHDNLLCAAHQHHKLICSSLCFLCSRPSFVELFDSLLLKATSSWKCGSVLVIQDETLKLLGNKSKSCVWFPNFFLLYSSVMNDYSKRILFAQRLAAQATNESLKAEQANWKCIQECEEED